MSSTSMQEAPAADLSIVYELTRVRVSENKFTWNQSGNEVPVSLVTFLELPHRTS